MIQKIYNTSKLRNYWIVNESIKHHCSEHHPSWRLQIYHSDVSTSQFWHPSHDDTRRAPAERPGSKVRLRCGIQVGCGQDTKLGWGTNCNNNTRKKRKTFFNTATTSTSTSEKPRRKHYKNQSITTRFTSHHFAFRHCPIFPTSPCLLDHTVNDALTVTGSPHSFGKNRPNQSLVKAKYCQMQ